MQIKPSCKCDYCGEGATLVTGLVIYPHRPDLYHLRFWKCDCRNAYVGCHAKGAKIGNGVVSDGTAPLGRLADSELRAWKSKAHAAFDPLWKGGELSRSKAYEFLSQKMGIDKDQCHIGQFDVEACKKVVEIMSKR